MKCFSQNIDSESRLMYNDERTYDMQSFDIIFKIIYKTNEC